jgi:hypothetical protein
MASLTETAHYTRKIIKIGAIALVCFFVFRFSLRLIGITWKKLNPPKPPAPTVAFGKLPPISFPENEKLPTLTFSLETIEGSLPQLDNLRKVYFIPKKIFSFLTEQEAIDKARSIGFTGEPEKLSETIYRWQREEKIPSFLTMDIVTQNFDFRYSYEKDQSLLQSGGLLTPEQALGNAITFMRKAGILLPDRAEEKTIFVYYRYSPPQLIKVSSLAETNFIKVNILRKEIDDLLLLPPHPDDANISFLVSKSNTQRIIDSRYTYFPIDQEVWATYPLKDVTQAWNELKDGQGFIASLGDNPSGEIIIRQVSLAYYDPHTHQNYLQPIFVFKGDKGFSAYLPAVANEWIER